MRVGATISGGERQIGVQGRGFRSLPISQQEQRAESASHQLKRRLGPKANPYTNEVTYTERACATAPVVRRSKQVR